MKQLVATLGLLLPTAILHAQEPAALRKVALPDLDLQVRARLLALDARLNPVHSPNLAAAFTGNLASPWSPFAALAPILADPDLYRVVPNI